ncbi:serine/threonine-protein kinase-like protein [Pleomassaria siparia CBS 279.74]|uniref:Serine/threonine-protein kinase-like protein n=1 Tax=Pleomassaria siparia CBS 279.74 TaxID=1314801 RepID=A0A6G1KC05_9PLEO|nr:serine/threonine-protein kinase-like protein [Pleomassaria siparia CBS 279.74]
MVDSPALSPRPNPPGAGPKTTTSKIMSINPKAKAVAILNTADKPIAMSADTTPSNGTADLAEQMNDDVRNQFVSGAKLGEGTYAIVYAGHYRHDPTRLVAIKKIKLNTTLKDGIAPDAIREIKHLSELSHPNIIQLHAIFSTKEQNISLVLEHLPLGDLEGLWKNHSISYGTPDIKSWASMLAQAVWFCHENFVLHRDIKGNNVLIAADGTLKLADFGLARSFADASRKMTCNVITRFYRPPELLLGCEHYGGKVDIWSTGIVIAELVLRDWFLPSNTDAEQLLAITQVFGTPTEETWPGVSTLKLAAILGASTRPQPMDYWRTKFSMLGPDGIDLLRSMLIMDPNKRFSARQVLEHRYWTSAPRPTKKEDLPKQGGGPAKVGEDLKRRAGELPSSGRGDKVARKLDFGSMR